MSALRFRSLVGLLSFILPAAAGVAAEAAAGDVVETPPSVLRRYDKNKDGVLDEAERAKWESDKAARREKERAERAAMLEKYDTDKDGKLGEAEKAEAKLGWQKERSEKEAEKMKERVAKAKAEREKAESEKAAREKAAQQAQPPEPASGTTSEKDSKSGKAGDDGMMMMSE